MNKQVAALAADEKHMVMWDIDAVLADFADSPSVRVPVSALVPDEWLTIDPQYALTTDVSIPIIVFLLPDKKAYIADGNHRLYRAVSEHIREMKAIIIPEKVRLQYLYPCSVKDYDDVISRLADADIFIDVLL